MKNYILLFILSCLSLPVYAVCPISDGVCTASSNWESKPLEQRLIPDNLQEIQRTDAFQPKYFKPYYDELINTEQENTAGLPPENNYNSNCQFGVCLPGVEPGEDVLE